MKILSSKLSYHLGYSLSNNDNQLCCYSDQLCFALRFDFCFWIGNQVIIFYKKIYPNEKTLVNKFLLISKRRVDFCWYLHILLDVVWVRLYLLQEALCKYMERVVIRLSLRMENIFEIGRSRSRWFSNWVV